MSKILSNGQAVWCENARKFLAITQREASPRQRGKPLLIPKAFSLQKNPFNTIEEPAIRVKGLFSGSSMVFLASNSRLVRTLFGYGRLTEG